MHLRSLVVLSLALVLPLAVAGTAGGKGGAGHQTGFTKWRAAGGGFAGWTLSHVTLGADGALTLDLATAEAGTDPAGTYNGRNFYNGGAYKVGEAVSPVVSTPFAFSEAIASWNAATPAGTWIETQIRARLGDRWTKWFNLGVWASGTGTVERHSVTGQRDADGSAIVDTLVLDGKAGPGSAFELKVRLFSAGTASPTLRNASVAFSTAPGKAGTPSTDDPAVPNGVITVPECSQMVYPDGGEVWCSPTSTSMVLAYWQGYAGPCEPRVRAAVEGVFDWVYDGHGNWPFNTAYAGAEGLEGYVARFTSLRDLEPWIAAGVPVVFSFAWKKSSLDGAAIPSSNGHLAVLVGFDGAGNPVVNDPAAATDADVTRTYDRGQLESRWLEASGGTVYLMYPPGHAVPALG